MAAGDWADLPLNGRGFSDNILFMNSIFTNITLVTKVGNDRAASLSSEISVWLRKQGLNVTRVDNRVQGKSLDLGDKTPDLVLVLGGDGTMLSVARKVGFNSIPFLGVNLGQVGFLADISPESWRDQLSLVFQGRYFLSSRLILEFEISRDGKPVHRGEGINDLVLNRNGMARLNRFNLFVDEAPRFKMRADGLIMSTPTGSTAYNISAGGPLVYPELDSFILTPICPFLQSFPPMVLPGSSRVRISVAESNPSMYLTVDGQAGYEVLAGDVLKVRRAEKKMTILATSGPEYFMAKLRERGFLSPGEVS